MLSWLVNPVNRLCNTRDMRVMLTCSRDLLDVNLERDEGRYNMAKYVHDELEAYLRTKKSRGQLASENPKTKLNSLDLVIYAYLKEEIVNTPESAEVAYLKESCPLLMARVEFFDTMFENSTSTQENEKKIEEEKKVEETKKE